MRVPPPCPRCRSFRVCWDGWRKRSASILAEEAVRHLTGIRNHRATCHDCRKGWTVRPPGLSPHRHYQLCVVTRALSNYLFDKGATQAKVAHEYDCSERTVGRWIRWAAGVANPAALGRKILVAAEHPILPTIKAVTDLGRKARTALRRQIVNRAAQIVSLMEALCMALRLEPPGLRGVVEWALRDRARMATYARPLIPEFVN